MTGLLRVQEMQAIAHEIMGVYGGERVGRMPVVFSGFSKIKIS
jgi:hypothetical protein